MRYREDGSIYAMKCMYKQAMVLKNQVAHVQAERDAMAMADNPWVVALRYSFQDDEYLYLVMVSAVAPHFAVLRRVPPHQRRLSATRLSDRRTSVLAVTSCRC